MPVSVTISPSCQIHKNLLCTSLNRQQLRSCCNFTVCSFSLWFGPVPSRPPSCKGERQRLRRWAAQALVCKSLHERPHLLQLVEAAAQKREDRRRVRGMCHDGCRGGVLSDCGDPAQRRGRLHPHRAARTRNTHSSYRLLLVCLMNRWLDTNGGADEGKYGTNQTVGVTTKNAFSQKSLISPKACILGLLSSRKGGGYWSISLLTC